MSSNIYHIFLSYTHNGGPRKDKYNRIDNIFKALGVSEESLIRKWFNHSEDYYVACKLERKIQSYKFPKDKNLLEKYPYIGKIKSIKVFRDENELGFDELTEELKNTIANSVQQVVIASPHSRQKPWINKEVKYFRETHTDKSKSIPYTIDGIPYAEQRLQSLEQECLPELFLEEFEEKCHNMTREEKDNYVRVFPNKRCESWNKSVIKIVANAFDIKPFDDLWRAECRRLRRIWIFRIIMLLFVIFLGYLFYCEHFKIYTEYYVKTVDRYGIPIGLHELSEEETSNYMSYVKLERKNHKVISAANYSFEGKLETRNLRQGLSELYDPIHLIRKFSYDEHTDKLESVSYLNSKNECLQRIVYHSDSLAEIRYPNKVGGYALNIKNVWRNNTDYNTFVYKLNERGEITELYLFRNSKDIEITEYTPALKYERDDYGRIIKQTVLNDAMASIVKDNRSKVFICKAEYNEDSSCRRIVTCDLNGNPQMNEDWSYITEINGQGTHCMEILYKDTLGTLCNTIDGVARCVLRVEDYHDYKEYITEYYGTENQLICNNENVCIKISDIYDNKEITRFFDTQKRPVYHKENMHMVIYESFNNDSTILSFYDVNGKLMNNPTLGYATKITYYKDNVYTTAYFDKDKQSCGNVEQHIAKKELVYNSYYQVIEERNYDSEGKLSYGNLDVAVKEYKYDKQGNLVEMKSTDGCGNLVNVLGQNYAIIRQEFDDRGLCTMVSYYDAKNRKCMGPENYSYIYNIYNNKGLLVKQIKYNEEDKPMAIPVIEYSYNVQGQICGLKYKDINDKLIIGEEGGAEVKVAYSDEGLCKLYSLYGVNGCPINGNEGYHCVLVKTDQKGLVLSESYRDIMGLPIKNGEGSRYLYEYDKRNLLIKEECIDETVNPNISESVIRGYNQFGDLKEETYYENNKFISKIINHFNYSEYYKEEWYLDKNDNLINSSSEPAIIRIDYTPEYSLSSVAFYNNKRTLFFNPDCQFAYCEVDNEYVYYFDEDSLLIRGDKLTVDKATRIDVMGKSSERFEIERPDKYTEITTYYQNDTIARNDAGYAILIIKKDDLGRIVEMTGYDEKYNRCNGKNGISVTKNVYVNDSDLIQRWECRDSIDMPVEDYLFGNIRGFKRQIIELFPNNMSYEAILNKEQDLVSSGWYYNQKQRCSPKGYMSFYTITYDNMKRIKIVTYYDVNGHELMMRDAISKSKYIYEKNSKIPDCIEHYNGVGILLGRVNIRRINSEELYLECRDINGNLLSVDNDVRKTSINIEDTSFSQIQLSIKNNKVVEMILDKEGKFVAYSQSLLQYQLCRQAFELPPLF